MTLELVSVLQEDKNQIHARNNKNAIVMYSGGLDSTVALWWAMHKYKNIKVYTVDYNQPHSKEIWVAEQIMDLIGINHKVIKVDLPEDFWGLQNHLTRGQACFMTSIAALDISHDGADIVMGILINDNYGDCNRAFLDSLADVLDHYNDVNKIGIATPLRALNNKSSVVAKGFILGAPIYSTWTCRKPVNGYQCGTCMQCQERKTAFESFEKDFGVTQSTLRKWQDVMGSPFHPSFDNVPREIQITAAAFVELGGLKNAQNGWKYEGPDGEWRVASIIKNPNVKLIKDYNKGIICKMVSVKGFLEGAVPWEVCICEDGTIATTTNLPPLNIIEKELAILSG